MGSWTLASIAFLVLAYAAAARRFEQSLVTSAMFFTTTGLIAGPGLGLIDLPAGGGRIDLLAQATLTLVLFADASRISLRSLRDEYSVPLRLLGLGLPLTIVAGTLAGAALFPAMTWAEALVLAVTLACTDAALGQAVVTDPRLPSLIRQGLNVESGLNDGICVPLFFIALGLAEVDASTVSSSLRRSPRRRRDRLRLARRLAGRSRRRSRRAVRDQARVDRDRVDPGLHLRRGGVRVRARARPRRKHLHRRVRRRAGVRNAAQAGRRRGRTLPRAERRAAERGDVHRLRRRDSSGRRSTMSTGASSSMRCSA